MRTARDVARNIVNQVLDESGASVEHRQAINDRCDEFVTDLLIDWLGEIEGALTAEIDATVLHGEGTELATEPGSALEVGADVPTPVEDPCPDCGNDPEDATLHADDCPRLDTTGQFGPPWKPRDEWQPFCREDLDGSCLQPKGHDGEHDPWLRKACPTCGEFGCSHLVRVLGD